MKTLKDYEQEFDKEFDHSEDCSLLRFEDFNKEPFADCYCQLKSIKQFYRRAIAELTDEMVGERVNIRERCGTTQCELFHDGYNQAKAEVRENRRKMLEI